MALALKSLVSWHLVVQNWQLLGVELSLDDILSGLAKIGFDNGLDHLVLNASIGYVGPVGDETDETLLSLLAVNLKGPLALCQSLYGALAIRAGSVCFISSTAAGRATPEFASYTASKTAINHFAGKPWSDQNGVS